MVALKPCDGGSDVQYRLCYLVRPRTGATQLYLANDDHCIGTIAGLRDAWALASIRAYFYGPLRESTARFRPADDTNAMYVISTSHDPRKQCALIRRTSQTVTWCRATHIQNKAAAVHAGTFNNIMLTLGGAAYRQYGPIPDYGKSQ